MSATVKSQWLCLLIAALSLLVNVLPRTVNHDWQRGVGSQLGGCENTTK